MFFYFCQTFLKRSPSEGKRPLPAVRRLVQQAGAGIQKGPAAGHGSIFAMISSGAAVHRLLLLGAVVPRHENALVGSYRPAAGSTLSTVTRFCTKEFSYLLPGVT